MPLQPRPNPETLVEAFHIAQGDSPLIPERAHLIALVEHSRLWNSTIMEASTPRPPKPSLLCEACEGTGKPEDSRDLRCDVCDGEGTVDFATVKLYFERAQDLEQKMQRDRLAHADRIMQMFHEHRKAMASVKRETPAMQEVG